jgi:4-hydroxy-3-methylbut-2-enyl diphosphate reductase
MLEEKADVAIVIGGYNSSNTSHLVELCEEKLPTYFIRDEHCLISNRSISHFILHEHKEVETTDYLLEKTPLKIMITSGASCPDALVERVMEKLCFITGNSDAFEERKSALGVLEV